MRLILAVAFVFSIGINGLQAKLQHKKEVTVASLISKGYSVVSTNYKPEGIANSSEYFIIFLQKASSFSGATLFVCKQNLMNRTEYCYQYQ